MNGIARSVMQLRMRGPARLVGAVARRFLRPRLRCSAAVKDLVSDKVGLEIGGPSDLFARDGLLPVYPTAKRVDNCTFSGNTVWESGVAEGYTFNYDARHAPGRQYVMEATDLEAIADEQYDFLLSSHTIEHVANPLRALREWVRAVRVGGALVLIVPHKEGTFDHRRPVTTMEHLTADDREGTGEADLTHLQEILTYHDLRLDPAAGDFATFKARSERNFENRCLHHHVFDTNLAVEMVAGFGLQIVAVEPAKPHHIAVVARKASSAQGVRHEQFLGARAAHRRTSPFAIDRAMNSL